MAKYKRIFDIKIRINAIVFIILFVLANRLLVLLIKISTIIDTIDSNKLCSLSKYLSPNNKAIIAISANI